MIDSILLLLLLVGLELVLGIDNILVISIFVGQLPAGQRHKARIIGLGLAFLARIVMLFILLKLSGLTQDVIGLFSTRDLILLAGGLFLIWKAVAETHHTIELKEGSDSFRDRCCQDFFVHYSADCAAGHRVFDRFSHHGHRIDR